MSFGATRQRPVVDVAVRLVRRPWCRCAGRCAGSAWRGWRSRARWSPRTCRVRRPTRGGVEHELEVLAEAEVEHLVGLVEDQHAQVGDVELAALQVVAQPAGRADDDVAAGGERALLAPDVHAADAGERRGRRSGRRARSARGGPAWRARGWARRPGPGARRARRRSRPRPAGWARRRGRRRRSCPSRSGRRPAGRGPPPRARGWRTGRAWARHSPGSPGRGRARGGFRGRTWRVLRADAAGIKPGTDLERCTLRWNRRGAQGSCLVALPDRLAGPGQPGNALGGGDVRLDLGFGEHLLDARRTAWAR